ncbi:MAG: hypothetical protein ABSE73_13260 [Planctomycetota bacterium]
MDYPAQILAGGGLKLTVYLPDAQKGYYRGPRFDWSGMVARAEYKGHTFFADWRTPHNPANWEHGIGPAEEFSMEDPPGYKEAKAGETYMKIGVGLLKKESAAAYAFYKANPIVKPGEWNVTSGADWMEFQQELAGSEHAYRYAKRIAIEKGGAFTIAHTLKNTGGKPLATTHYCHNFIVIDDEPVGPDYRLAFAFDCAIAQKAGTVQVEAQDKRFSFLQPMPDKATLWVLLKGAGNTNADNRITVENTKAGAGLRIVGDQTGIKYVVYAEKTAVCPEVFVRIELNPGDEATWTNRYELFLSAGEK